MNMESNNISQSRRNGPFSGEKGPIIWQLRFTFVLLQVVFYVKARLCRSQGMNKIRTSWKTWGTWKCQGIPNG